MLKNVIFFIIGSNRPGTDISAARDENACQQPRQLSEIISFRNTMPVAFFAFFVLNGQHLKSGLQVFCKMNRLFAKLLFDKRDHDLIKILEEVRHRDGKYGYARKRYYPLFHPNGIKEKAEPRGLRIAYAVAHLLDSLEVGRVEDRINALRMLRAEVIDAAAGPLPKNTARVLLEIMKELVRSRDDYERQLMLAHDFRTAASGKPRIIRRHLRRYHLLEMPEEWNQITFDDHVHDANSKGRKTPTHLVMDAWIKGIRRLRVIHYNFAEARFAAELFTAAQIMNVDVRMGIEFYARYRNRYIQLIWVPRGFTDLQDFLIFLADPKVVQLMDEGRAVSAYQQQHVMALLRRFNSVHLDHFNNAYNLSLAPIDEASFLKFVGIGQKSKVHLAEYIQNNILQALHKRMLHLKQVYQSGDGQTRQEIDTWIDTMRSFDIEATVKTYLSREKNPDIPYPDTPRTGKDVPALLTLTAPEMLARLSELRSGYRITLNMTDLRADEVLEILYDCQGAITRLELFNLKDYAQGKTENLADVNRLQQAINNDSIISLKQTVRNIISKIAESDYPDRADREEKLNAILYDLDSLKTLYQETPLKARLGSDSTGRSFKMHGMGLAVKETLPLNAQREVHWRKSERVREVLPLHIRVHPRRTYIPHRPEKPLHPLLYRFALSAPFLNWIGFKCNKSWEVASASTRMTTPGNIVTLGGIRSKQSKNFDFQTNIQDRSVSAYAFGHLNTRLKNSLKVLLGFVPAFLTFALTKDWWVLAYLGAFIWFAITGVRNIIQSVLGGGGLQRSPLLRWNDYVSWDRITDSLLYTGFSVPLLDYVVKTVILDRGFGITTSSQPVLLYTFMALANGLYLFSHNTFRGLPRTAAVGNLFRSILSIPIAVALNTCLSAILPMAGIINPDAALQKWAAIISKTASDFVAGIIEGLADRYANIHLRLRDYRQKFNNILSVYSELELLHPNVKTFNVLETAPRKKRTAHAETVEMERIIMLHALDLLYFWMYQPRAQSAFKRFLESLSEDERQIMVSSQFTLQRSREISQLFIDGIFGSNFPKPLSFYLARYTEYLTAIKRLGLS